MTEDPDRPLTLKERMQMLQEASNGASSPSSSSKSQAGAPAVDRAPAGALDGNESTNGPARTRAEDVLVAELRDATSTGGPAEPLKQSDALSAYPALSPTLSASSSRPASPYMSPTSAYDSLADQSSRRRAGSTASAFSALSSVSRESGDKKGLEMEMGGLGIGAGSSERPSVKSMVSSREAGSAVAPKLDTSTTFTAPNNSLMAFSPTVEEPSSSLPPSSAPIVPSRIPHSPPLRRSTIASTSSQSSMPSLPPRLPPRRSQSTAEPPSPTASTFSTASTASSQGPALPPRPRAPTATPPRPSPSPSSLSATPSSSRPAYARHSPKARQDGFESVSLTSAGGAELAKSLAAATSTPTIAHPLSSPANSFAGAPQPVTGRQRPVDPRARRRYEVLFDKCLRKAEAQEGGGAPRPAWVKTNGGSEGQRLEGSVVRGIWSRSRLDRDVLRGIWSACVPEGKGSLDREGFVKGLWMIDEELRRVQKDRSRANAED